MRTSPITIILAVSLLTTEAKSQWRVSEDHHYITRNGQPFSWLGDTAWELFHKLNKEGVDKYLSTRAAQGFTVIQAAVLAELDGLHTPNANGDTPLVNDDPLLPVERYFKHVDYILSKARSLGLVIALLPTWGDKVNQLWGKGPVIFNIRNAKAYGYWLADRYREMDNIIWILGGDRNPENAEQLKIWNAMAEGITEACGTTQPPLISYHCQPGTEGSAKYFRQQHWFSFNMFQNGHCRNTPVFDNIHASYQRLPVKPVIDGEPLYEDHPVCFNVKDLGTSSAYDVRMYAYLDMFAGAFGHTYGCHDVWQFFDGKSKGINGPHLSWTEALELPGALQMNFLKQLMDKYSIVDRIPDQSLVDEASLPVSIRIQCLRGRLFELIYTAAGVSFTANLGKVKGSRLSAFWFDPRTGNTTAAGTFVNSGQKHFDPPTSGYGSDWVLILTAN